MTTFALVDQVSGEIVNRIVIDAESDWTPPEGCEIAAGDYEIGGTLIDGVYTPPAPPVALAPLGQATISDRQFFQQLAIEGIITTAEALAAVKTGEIPAVLQGYVNIIEDAGQRFAAEMLLSGATVFERNHPLTTVIGAGQGMSEADVDQFFRSAATL